MQPLSFSFLNCATRSSSHWFFFTPFFVTGLVSFCNFFFPPRRCICSSNEGAAASAAVSLFFFFLTTRSLLAPSFPSYPSSSSYPSPSSSLPSSSALWKFQTSTCLQAENTPSSMYEQFGSYPTSFSSLLPHCPVLRWGASVAFRTGLRLTRVVGTSSYRLRIELMCPFPLSRNTSFSCCMQTITRCCTPCCLWYSTTPSANSPPSFMKFEMDPE
mmetsp:Transcript_9441/g.23069  ORF Transcript_9441/g.23069 Transcript_9441/m.23069 type:complete len:215 (-) Transcript_9441:234-878(-)